MVIYEIPFESIHGTWTMKSILGSMLGSRSLRVLQPPSLDALLELRSVGGTVDS